MNKKSVFLGLFALGIFTFTPATLPAQANFSPDDISTILEDNVLRDVAARYTSVLSYFFPEEATRLGFSSANNVLNDRSLQTQDQALQAFKSILASLKEVDPLELSAAKRVEYTLLQDAITRNIWMLEQNRLTTDPLYYAQAFDALYDLLLLPTNANNQRKQRTDLMGRVEALPKVAQQAKENLTSVSPILARLAMEKAYFAYLSFDEIENRILKGAALSNDARDTAQTENTILKAKATVRELFDFFKKLSQQEESDGTDFRLGTVAYTKQLQQVYQINDHLTDLGRQLQTGLEQAQHALFDALQPFELSAEDEQITLIEDGVLPQVQPVTAQTDTKKTPAKPVYTPPTANQFYGIAKQLQSPLSLDQVLAQITQKATELSTKWVKQALLPTPVNLKINPLPTYFAYQDAYLYSPAYNTFLMRLPFGNQLAKEEMLQRDFNEPAYKLFITQELVPGRYYQNAVAKSNMRRLFGAPALANGWTLYAVKIAQEQGYLITDEEQLFIAWNQYLWALAAWLDYQLNTLAYTYNQALTFLTQEGGFSQEQATLLLNQIVRTPAQAVSYIWGAQTWQHAADTYSKKLKTPGALNALLLQVGNVSPSDLTKELKRVYKKK